MTTQNELRLARALELTLRGTPIARATACKIADSILAEGDDCLSCSGELLVLGALCSTCKGAGVII
jgi:hypothetical protein